MPGPVFGRPSIRGALFSQGLSASVNARTPPEAADGTTCSATRNALRGSLDEIKQPSRPSRWHFVLALRSHRHIANKSAECHLVLFWRLLLPKLGCGARMAETPRKLMLPLPLQALPSNPSIEGMPKRLRLLVTPHVKR
jgi:hypothetical protein